MAMTDEDHQDWCDEDHDEGEPCASEWRGSRDDERGTEILTRVLQRPGEEPVVQISLTADGQSVIGEFSPIGARGDRIGEFPDILAGDAGAAWTYHSQTR